MENGCDCTRDVTRYGQVTREGDLHCRRNGCDCGGGHVEGGGGDVHACQSRVCVVINSDISESVRITPMICQFKRCIF